MGCVVRRGSYGRVHNIRFKSYLRTVDMFHVEITDRAGKDIASTSLQYRGDVVVNGIVLQVNGIEQTYIIPLMQVGYVLITEVERED